MVYNWYYIRPTSQPSQWYVTVVSQPDKQYVTLSGSYTSGIVEPMIALPLQTVIFVALLAIVGAGLVAIVVDRRRLREPLLVRAGIEPDLLGQRFNSAPFGLLLLDSQWQAIYANTYARRLFPGDPPLKSTDDNPWPVALQQDLVAARSQGDDKPFYRVLTLPTGQTISWWICPLPRLSLLFVTDLSHQRRLEKSSQTFLSTLSHELRTPLTAVLAHLDIVRKQDVNEGIRQNSLTIIHQELNRLARLVQDMLKLGHLEVNETVEKRPLDLLLVAEAAIAEIILVAEAKEISVSLEATAALPYVPGDADKLKQAFLNVLDNSIKYGRPGTQVKVCLIPENGGVRVDIKDTGPGISPEHLPLVTERLYRANTDVPGSGLGLAITSEILRLHNGQMEVDSPGKNAETGVEISFLLPANEPEQIS